MLSAETEKIRTFLHRGPRPDKFAFVEQSGTMKAPVGLLSDRTVLRSKMEGLCPDKFAFVEQTCLWGRRDRLIMLPANHNPA